MATPYELRFDILKMARELAAEEFYIKRDQILEQWRSACHNAESVGANHPEMPKIPDFPSAQDIMKLAESLNVFVSVSRAPRQSA
jgi:hypothetical protein